MHILALETTGPIGSVAVIDENENTAAEYSAEKMSHLKDLIPLTEKLLRQQGIPKTALAAVAASIGPGSFTGIRIGVSTARALAQALEIPAIAVPTLETFRLRCSGERLIVPLLNARRGQVYGAIFSEDGAELMAPGPYLLQEVLVALTEVLREKPILPGGAGGRTVTFYGDGIEAYGEALASFEAEMKSEGAIRIEQAGREDRNQNAVLAAKLALQKYRKGEILPYNELLPDYMRITEAEQKLADGTLEKERARKMARFRAR